MTSDARAARALRKGEHLTFDEAPGLPLRGGARTVRHVCNAFLASHESTVARKTFNEAKRLFDRELDPIAEVPAKQLSRSRAYALIDGMRDRPVVAKLLKQQLGAAWNRAVDAGELPQETPNWWRLILRGKLTSRGKSIDGQLQGPAKRVPSDSEVSQLLRWLPNFTRDVEDALTLYLWTGCRGAEIVAMERSELAGRRALVDDSEGQAQDGTPLTVDLRVPLVGRAAAVVSLGAPEGLSKSAGARSRPPGQQCAHRESESRLPHPPPRMAAGCAAGSSLPMR